jgi:hypothetical protein
MNKSFHVGFKCNNVAFKVYQQVHFVMSRVTYEQQRDRRNVLIQVLFVSRFPDCMKRCIKNSNQSVKIATGENSSSPRSSNKDANWSNVI